MDNIYYIPVNTTLFPAGTVCCLGHVLAYSDLHSRMQQNMRIYIELPNWEQQNAKTNYSTQA
jgi:hypothetical protein